MKQQPYDIVCVAQPSWDGPYAKSTVLLMKELSNFCRVLYVDYAFTWKDWMLGLMGKNLAPIGRMLGFQNRLRVIEGQGQQTSLAVLTLPPVLPVNFLPKGLFFDFFNFINSVVVSRSIRRAMKTLHFQSPIVVNAFAPGIGIGLVGKLGEQLNLYYCYDEIKEAVWSGKHGGEQEETFMHMVDGLIVSSDPLMKDKLVANPQTYVVKNGVDTNLFQPGEFRPRTSNSKVVIGFVGSLDFRVDLDLLEKLIKHTPEYTFRFIGRVVDQHFMELVKLENVEWIPPVPYAQLPSLVREFDLGIIPFVCSRFTEKIYPLKINEYLAMGKPVVMTPFAKLPEFDGIVSCGDGYEAFRKVIETCLAADNAQMSQSRVDFAKGNSWKERAREFRTAIDQIAHEKEVVA